MDLIQNSSLFTIGLIGFIVMIAMLVYFDSKSEKNMRDLSFDLSKYRLDQEWLEANKFHGYCEVLSVVFFLIGLFGLFG